SSTVAPVAMEIAKRFEANNPDIRIDVQTGGSTRGVVDSRSGMADIGMVSRHLKAAESDLTAHTIARDGISIILHDSNIITELSQAQIIAIYTGKIRNWSEVGGKDQAITVVNKADGRATLELFLKYFALKNSQIKAQVVIGDNQQGIKTVSGNPGAIGYVSIGAAEYEQSVGTPIKLLPMNGVAANLQTLKNGEFPLSRPLNLVTKSLTPLSQKFIDFAQSQAVEDLIKAQYFVPATR
ncbi:MAG: phosphate ABC transporter substrate-binding protein, partial [Methylophaga sp.]|nr:phosphate ABC transporter substrate-binding protein [Methylophaga sp.]